MPKEALYEVGSVIEFVYRCNGDPATASPSVTIFDETKTAVVPDLTVGSGLTQIGVTRLFKGAFTPDAEGVWTLHGTDVYGGDMAKDYAVGLQGMQSMAVKITAIDTKADLILVDTAAIQTIVTSVEAKVDINTAAIAVIDGKVDVIDGKLTILDGKVDSVQGGVDDANTKLDDLSVDAGGAHFA